MRWYIPFLAAGLAAASLFLTIYTADLRADERSLAARVQALENLPPTTPGRVSTVQQLTPTPVPAATLAGVLRQWEISYEWGKNAVPYEQLGPKSKAYIDAIVNADLARIVNDPPASTVVTQPDPCVLAAANAARLGNPYALTPC